MSERAMPFTRSAVACTRGLRYFAFEFHGRDAGHISEPLCDGASVRINCLEPILVFWIGSLRNSKRCYRTPDSEAAKSLALGKNSA